MCLMVYLLQAIESGYLNKNFSEYTFIYNPTGEEEYYARSGRQKLLETPEFNKIVNKFSNTSQFIIVTHNKRTMNNADIIYGITMPEQGVSKVVPVDLRNLKI